MPSGIENTMKRLSEAQLQLAAAACRESARKQNDPMGTNLHCFMRALEAAAPFLQLPWDEPTLTEVRYANTKGSSFGLVPSDAAGIIIDRFVRSRNEILLPKPVDPRRDRIIEVLKYYPDRAPEIADKIISALDEVEQ